MLFADILYETDKDVYGDLNALLDIEIVPVVGMERLEQTTN